MTDDVTIPVTWFYGSDFTRKEEFGRMTANRLVSRGATTMLILESEIRDEFPGVELERVCQIATDRALELSGHSVFPVVVTSLAPPARTTMGHVIKAVRVHLSTGDIDPFCLAEIDATKASIVDGSAHVIRALEGRVQGFGDAIASVVPDWMADLIPDCGCNGRRLWANGVLKKNGLR